MYATKITSKTKIPNWFRKKVLKPRNISYTIITEYVLYAQKFGGNVNFIKNFRGIIVYYSVAGGCSSSEVIGKDASVV